MVKECQSSNYNIVSFFSTKLSAFITLFFAKNKQFVFICLTVTDMNNDEVIPLEAIFISYASITGQQDWDLPDHLVG